MKNAMLNMVTRVLSEEDGFEKFEESELDELIVKRCQIAVLGNKEYQEMQIKLIEADKNCDFALYEDLNSKMQKLIAKISYTACIKDVICNMH